MSELVNTKRTPRMFGSKGGVMKTEEVPVHNNAQKWTVAIGEQIQKKNVHENVQYLPLTSVILDPLNTRHFTLNREKIKNGPKLPIDDGRHLYDEEFENIVNGFFAEYESSANCTEEYLSLAKLACSIDQSKNLINPITVIQEDMNFRVIAGHRRVLAHEILSEDSILARIIPNTLSPLDKLLLQWRENEDREDLKIYDMLEAVARICDMLESNSDSPLSIRDLAKTLGMSKSKLGRYIKIIRAYKKNTILREAISNNRFKTINDIYEFLQIGSTVERSKLLNEINELKTPMDPFTIKNAKENYKKNEVTKKSSDDVQTDLISFQKNTNKDVVKEMILSLSSATIFKDFNINEFELNTLSDIQLVINAMYMHIDT